MQRFIGRKNELNSLEQAYAKDTFQMCILYGRRRIGKTTLVNQFLQDKECISYTAINGGLERNIRYFSEVVLNYFAPNLTGITFTDLKDILNFITQNLGEKKLVLFIDELPYLSNCDPSFLSLLQVEIDQHWLERKIFVILSGSSISFMEQEVLSSKSPIYGRRTMQIDLKPFSYLEVAEFVPDYTYEEKAICYGVTGGIAKYISLFDEKKSLDQNICELYFSPSGFMFEEPYNLLTQEFKNVSIYNDIIAVISNGANKVVEMKDKTHLENASIHNVLLHLQETRIIKKVYSITEEKNKKKVQYTLSDGMFLFWNKFIPKAVTAIENGNGKNYYLAVVKPKLHEYMGEIYEKMCRDYLILHAFSSWMPCTIYEVGKWYGINPQKKEPTDIDIVALDTINHKAILGECKFRNSMIDKNVLDELRARNGLIDRKYTTVSYFLFSLGGFTKWFEENPDDFVKTIPIEKMYEMD